MVTPTLDLVAPEGVTICGICVLLNLCETFIMHVFSPGVVGGVVSQQNSSKSWRVHNTTFEPVSFMIIQNIETWWQQYIMLKIENKPHGIPVTQLSTSVDNCCSSQREHLSVCFGAEVAVLTGLDEINVSK